MSRNALILLGLFSVGMAMSAGIFSLLDRTAIAQAQTGQAGTLGRYQFTSYAGSTPEGLHHGVYIIDTTTGQLWHASLGGEPQVIARKLPQ